MRVHVPVFDGTYWRVGRYFVNGNGVELHPRDVPSAREINHCCDFIRQRTRKLKSFNRRTTSYGLKHEAERWGTVGYVSNGSFIAAACSLGLSVAEAGIPNVYLQLRVERPHLSSRLGPDGYADSEVAPVDPAEVEDAERFVREVAISRRRLSAGWARALWTEMRRAFPAIGRPTPSLGALILACTRVGLGVRRYFVTGFFEVGAAVDEHAVERFITNNAVHKEQSNEG